MTEKTVSLPVTGMTCANCATNIERNVRKLSGVQEANVNFASERVTLTYDGSLLGMNDIVTRIRKAGYDVPEQTFDLAITGMDCVNCAMNVERALKKVDGVLDVNVNFATEHALVTAAAGMPREELVSAVEKAGYNVVQADDEAELEDAEQAARQAEIRRNMQRVLVGAIFTIPLLILSMGHDLGIWGMWSHEPWVQYLFWALATPVQFWVGREFYISGYKSIRGGSANMDVLIALGSSVAYFYSVPIALGWLSGHAYFETAAS
ncbi:MAG: cation-transporting ATPase PacS, partial [Planctomycetaceae bacterium]